MAKHLPWFRLYTDIIDNVKIRILSPEERWYFVAILCIKNTGYLDRKLKPDLFLIGLASKLGLEVVELAGLKSRLVDVGLINDRWQPTGWDDLQFKSDSSKERQAKHVQKKKAAAAAKAKLQRDGDVTLNTRHGDGELTLQDKDYHYHERNNHILSSTTKGRGAQSQTVENQPAKALATSDDSSVWRDDDFPF